MYRKYFTILFTCLCIAGAFLWLTGKEFATPAEARQSPPALTVTGHLGQGYLPVARHHKTHSPHLDRGVRLVDSVLAIPVTRANVSPQSMAQSIKAPVHANGSFDLRLPGKNDYLLVLFNSLAGTQARFAGQIALRIEASEVPLLFLPADKLRDRKLNLGLIQAEGDMAVPVHVIRNREWTLTPAQLSLLAKNGTGFKNVKNLVVNYDAGNGITYTLRPDFHWEGSYAGMKNGFSYPTKYTHYNFQMDTNSPEIIMDMICGTNGVSKAALQLFPPAGTSITAGNPPMVYNLNTPMANNNAICSPTPDGFIEARDEDFFATSRYGHISYAFGSSLLTDPIPGGYWQYRVDSILRAQFDEGMTAPKAPDGMVNGLIPAIHANRDANGKITSFDMKWYQRDESDPKKYTEITDLSLLASLVSSAGIFLENTSTGQRRYESVSFDPATQTSISTGQEWYYGVSGPVNLQAERIGTFHISAGLGYFFEYPRIIFPAGDPACILPVPDAEIGSVKKGQQYNPSQGHDGLDFGFTDWPATSGQYALHEIVAPLSGVVTEINGHIITGGPNSSNNYAYTVVIQYNEDWSTFVCFEPDTKDQTLVDLQKQKIAVTVGQKISQGDPLGQLVVSLPSSPQVFGPHVHWQLYRADGNGQSLGTVCPWTYSTGPAQTALDSLYQSCSISPSCAP